MKVNRAFLSFLAAYQQVLTSLRKIKRIYKQKDVYFFFKSRFQK